MVHRARVEVMAGPPAITLNMEQPPGLLRATGAAHCRSAFAGEREHRLRSVYHRPALQVSDVEMNLQWRIPPAPKRSPFTADGQPSLSEVPSRAIPPRHRRICQHGSADPPRWTIETQ